MPVSSYVQSYCEFFTTLDANFPLEKYCEVFDADAYFEDPFQKVNGVENIYNVFQHMYETLVEPSFEIIESVQDDRLLYIRWHFRFKMKQDAEFETFVGVSRVMFNDAGKAISHIDYWDAASHVYEKIPLLGSILRWIKGKVRA